MTVADILTLARYSLVLAEDERLRAALYGGRLDPKLPTKIYIMSKAVGWANAQGAAYPGLTASAAHLYTLCDRFALEAKAFLGAGSLPVNSGSGGSTAPKGTVTSMVYTAGGGETSFTDSRLVNATLIFMLRGGMPQALISSGTPGSGTAKFTAATGTVDVNVNEPFSPLETVGLIYSI